LSYPSKKLKWKRRLLNPRKLPKEKRDNDNQKKAARVTQMAVMTLMQG